MYKLSAVLTGVLVAVMVTFNGLLANQIGDYLAVLVVHIVGLITISFILIFGRKKIHVKRDIPVYLFGAGAIGVVLVLFNNICFKYLGISITLALGLFGQSIASGIIDHFGLLGMDTHTFRKEKLVGLIMIFAGIIVMVVY